MTLTTCTEYCTKGPSQCNKARERNKTHTVWEKSESTFSHRQHNYLNVKSKGICKNVTRKKEKTKPRARIGKEIIKIRTKTNRIEHRKTMI